MNALLMILALSAGVPTTVARAVTEFKSGNLYLRTIGMEPEGDFRRDGATAIPEYSEGCEYTRGLELELEMWNSTMLRLWENINRPETFFTLRAGEEYLIYEEYLLFYTSPVSRTQIAIHPEELWRILSHLGRNPSAATSQLSMEGWYPGLGEEPVMAFITVNDPVYDTVEGLLERGREATLLE